MRFSFVNIKSAIIRKTSIIAVFPFALIICIAIKTIKMVRLHFSELCLDDFFDAVIVAWKGRK